MEEKNNKNIRFKKVKNRIDKVEKIKVTSSGTDDKSEGVSRAWVLPYCT